MINKPKAAVLKPSNLSLQKESFLEDQRLLDSYRTLFRVVQSILSHPFSLLKRNDAIFRADQVANRTVEDVRLTCADTSLWKRKNGLPSPEYVHAVDYDIKYNNNENFFLLYLLNDISKELKERSLFYSSLLVTAFSSEADAFKEVNPSRERIRYLNIRLGKILDTSFFVGLKKKRPKGFTPIKTNVLRNHPEYLYCFRFYQNRLAERKNAVREKKAYQVYSSLLPQVLSYRGFEPVSNNKEKSVYLYAPYYQVICYPRKDLNGFVFDFDNLLDHRISSKHLLYIRKDIRFNGLLTPENQERWKDFDTVEALSLFHQVSFGPEIHHKETKKLDETWLRQDYFNDILRVRTGERKIYGKYCPSCKSNHVHETDKDIYVCPDCTSKYAFFDVDDVTHIQFRRLRRKDS